MPSPVAPVVPAIEMSGVAVGAMRDLHTVVVEDVNWTVAPGEFWAVAGLQGAGKSDFLMMTAGLVSPIAGSYRMFGAPMPIFEDGRLRERLRLGLVFDGGQLFTHLTVFENVALPLRYHQNLTKAEAHAEVRQMLELTGLTEWADSTPGAIGRNWQKRVGLARALMLKPEVLLLDNPLGGMDRRHRNWWLAFLGRLAKGADWLEGRPMTLVATTDDLRLWRGRATCFAMMKEKRFIVLGAWADVEAASDELLRELAGELRSV